MPSSESDQFEEFAGGDPGDRVDPGDQAETDLDLVACPECDALNPRTAAICADCHRPIDVEAVEEGRSRRRHPAGKRKWRSAKSADPGGIDDDAIVWQARIPTKERVKRDLPEWSYQWINRERLRWVGIGLGALAILVVVLAWPDSARTERSGELDLTFRYPGGWYDMSHSTDLPSAFTIAPRLLDGGADVSLAISREGASLAMLTLEEETETDTTPAGVLNDRAEAIRLIYQLSTDARAGQAREVTLLGTEGLAIPGERIASGQRVREESIVLLLEGREVYVLMAAPEAQWETDRQAMEQILKSAKKSGG